MHHRYKHLLAAVISALAFGAFVSAASANRIALSNQFFRITWNNLKFKSTFATVECHLTIEGSYHSRTLPKVAEQLVGYVTRAIIDEGHCTGGSARVLAETLPWHIRYESFAGTLPLITSVRLKKIGTAFWIHVLGSSCLFKATAASPLKGTVNISTAAGQVGQVESVTPEAAPIPLSTGTFPCPASGTFEGASTRVSLLGSTTKITVTLVQ